MAKSNSGILGPFSGKVGPVIGSQWRGINYIKSVSTKQTKKPSAAQQANRTKFRFLGQWLEPLHPYVNVGFFNPKAKLTAVNQAFRFNYKEALMGNYPNFSIDYAKACLSRGVLETPKVQQLELVEEGSVKISWDKQTTALAAPDDQLMLVLFAADLKFADGGVGLAKRSDGMVTYPYSKRLSGQHVDLYISFIGLSRKRVSNSIYLGRMLLP